MKSIPQKAIYFMPNSMDFWWSVYGLIDKIANEVLFLYERRDTRFSEISSFIVCARKDLLARIEGVEYNTGDPVVREIKSFLKSSRILCYSRPTDFKGPDYINVTADDETEFINPQKYSIELWYPEDYLTIKNIIKSIKAYCYKFLKINAHPILFKEIMYREQAITYFKDNSLYSSRPVKINYSNDLVEYLCHAWGKSREEVLDMLDKGINKR